MNHEAVHVRQKHWLDLLLSGLLCTLQWFNPVVWIYSRFIRQNHEYLADEVALGNFRPGTLQGSTPEPDRRDTGVRSG